MPDPNPSALTPRQQAWFNAIREGFARETGRTLEQWAEIARACPETKHRARLAWMKAEHGLGQNRAAMVLNAAFPSDSGWSTPAPLEQALWSDPAARAIFERVRETMLQLPDAIVGERKAFTAFSRRFQFAAARPAAGAVVLGLAVDPATHRLLRPPRRAAWSERLRAEAELAGADALAALADPIRAAWEAS